MYSKIFKLKQIDNPHAFEPKIPWSGCLKIIRQKKKIRQLEQKLNYNEVKNFCESKFPVPDNNIKLRNKNMLDYSVCFCDGLDEFDTGRTCAEEDKIRIAQALEEREAQSSTSSYDGAFCSNIYVSKRVRKSRGCVFE